MIELSTRDKMIAVGIVTAGVLAIASAEPEVKPEPVVQVIDNTPAYLQVDLNGMPCLVYNMDDPKILCDQSVKLVTEEPVVGPTPGAKIDWPDTGYKKEPVVSATVSTIDPEVAKIIEPNKVTGFNYLTGKAELPKGLL